MDRSTIVSRTAPWRGGFLVCLLILGFTVNAGMWAKLTEPELVEQSNLIVVGTLIGRTRMQASAEGPTVTVGVIAVEEVLKGGKHIKVALLALRSPEQPISSSDIFYSDGQQGLWFLRLVDPARRGVFLADHPQRFVPMAESGPRIQSLRTTLAHNSTLGGLRSIE